MNSKSIFFSFTILFSACIHKSDIKNEIAEYHACVTKCEDIESNYTFNFYKCSQSCLDMYDEKMKICNTIIPPELRDKGRVDLLETRNLCLEKCQQQVISVKAEIKAEIKKCKDICVYHLKK